MKARNGIAQGWTPTETASPATGSPERYRADARAATQQPFGSFQDG